MAVVLAGVLQLILGFARAGFIAYFFPSSVIKGMLTGIGLLIILKQIPHALGWDADVEGDFSFFQADGENTLSEITKAFDFITPGALLISSISLGLLILWDKILIHKHKIFQLIQGPVVVVILGILFHYLFQKDIIDLSLNAKQVVSIPVPSSWEGFLGQFTLPDFTALKNPEVWKIAFVMAIVASLETLLCVEATDKLDPDKRITPTNQELKAQGLGNIVSGLIGGLPITQVIVRSSANISFGGKSKLSAILHGGWLLISAVTIGAVLNQIPLASLAAILLMVGYKLAKPTLFKEMYQLGNEQFVPFLVTVIAILATDLLKGITAGMIVGIFYTLLHSFRNSHHIKDIVTQENGQTVHHLVLAEEVSFFNKANVLQALNEIPAGSKVIIDYARSKAVAYDVLEVIKDFQTNAKIKNIVVEIIESAFTPKILSRQ
jgi:SulP family sulfate permease